MSASCQSGASWSVAGASKGRTWASNDPSTAAQASAMVRKFSHEKLPLSTNHDCVTMMITAAMDESGSGANRNQGTTSCAAWLAATSTLWSGLGRWWKYQLNGLGIGWVSWW